MIRRNVLNILAAAVVAVGFTGMVRADDLPSLKDAYAKDFLIGTAFDFTANGNLSADEIAMIKRQYSVITPENSMKPGPIHPQEGTYNWETPDKLVAFCQENNIALIGHNLAWHSQNAAWMFSDEPSKEKVIERLRDHIHTVVGRYKGKIKGWDVVNEAIADGMNDGTTENLRGVG